MEIEKRKGERKRESGWQKLALRRGITERFIRRPKGEQRVMHPGRGKPGGARGMFY